jgi:hypothetical protein
MRNWRSFLFGFFGATLAHVLVSSWIVDFDFLYGFFGGSVGMGLILLICQFAFWEKACSK